MNILSRTVVVLRMVMFASWFEWKMDMQPDFPINSPDLFYTEVEIVPRTARFASACPAHITVVVYQEGPLLTQCGVVPPADREAEDTKQTVFISELLMIEFVEILIKSHMTVQTCDT